ncbi:MAG: hypothetical protein U0167_10895 [bacterium]
MSLLPRASSFAALLAITLVSCVPVDTTGPSRPPGDGKKNDDSTSTGDPQDPPADPPRFSFSISGSAEDPSLHDGLPATGAYDLYLWLVCANYGLAQLQADFDVTGDALVADHFFSPVDGVVSIVWNDFGQLNLAVSGCPQHATLLGRLHFTGSGAGVRIVMKRPSDTMGAIDCEDETRVSGFACVGYASTGTVPELDPADTCAPMPSASPVLLAISASSSHPYEQSDHATDGPVTLWLWQVSGALTALQGEVHVVGGAAFDPLFSAQPPYMSLTVPNGPDVLLASPGCSSGAKLLGSLLVVDDGNGVWVQMTPGIDGGAADCATPTPAGVPFRCRAFSSRH